MPAIVFDLDDTLYPERDFVFSAYRAVADAFARPLHVPFDLLQRMQELFDTPDRGRVFNVILAQAGVTGPRADALLADMIATYRTHEPRIRLHPDADHALTRFRAGHRLGLISDGPLEMQKNKVGALGLPDRLDEIILTDQWGREFWKPHPRAFEEMSQRLGLPPDQCAYVADNPAKDFVAPASLGWRTVCIRRPGGIYADQKPARGTRIDQVIESLNVLVSR
ncbi:MAG TPA: HAD family hydrolase [Phycisphaerae bacterium]|nr:HAD family hydrolase [Phycisphaerae bacterium]